MDIQPELADSRPVIVLGAKPSPDLPAIEPQAVITSKGAVELGLEYRERYGSPVIALVPGSAELYDRDYMIDLLKRVKPEEIVVLGKEKNFDPIKFIQENLGLGTTKVTVYSFFDRNYSLIKIIGWRRWLLMLEMLWIRGVKHFLVTALPGLFTDKGLNWLSRSTGINGMLYAQQRFPEAAEIIVAGIGLEAGGHFNGRGNFTAKSAKSDQIIMTYWKKNKRPRISTTDERLSEIGDVPLWSGKDYLDSKYSK